ncbi:MAG: type III polyketide synthase [Planctomycetota bacterium]
MLSLAVVAPGGRLDQVEAAAMASAIVPLEGDAQRQRKAAYARAGIQNRGVAIMSPGDSSNLDVLARQTLFAPGGDGPTTGDRMARYREIAPAMAVEAARRCLDSSGVARERVTHLITVSCTGFAAPGPDTAIIQTLGLSRDTARTHVGFMGCHAVINALRLAIALGSDPSAVILLVAFETCSLHFHYSQEPQKVIANALFADGSAAVLLGQAQAGQERPRPIATASTLIPDTQEAMSWHIGQHGFEMTLSLEVPGLIEANLRAWLLPWLAARGLAIGDVAGWAVHPGGPRILDAVQRALGLSPQALGASREVLAENGNMSSPTVLFILDRLVRSGVRGRVVMLAFGPGLAAEAALFEC